MESRRAILVLAVKRVLYVIVIVMNDNATGCRPIASANPADTANHGLSNHAVIVIVVPSPHLGEIGTVFHSQGAAMHLQLANHTLRFRR